MNIKNLNDYLSNVDTTDSEACDEGTSEGARKAWIKRHAHMNPHERAEAWSKMKKEDLSDLEPDFDDLNKSMARYYDLYRIGDRVSPEDYHNNVTKMNDLRKKLRGRGIAVNARGPMFSYTGKSGIEHELEGWKSLPHDKVYGKAEDGIFGKIGGAIKGAVKGAAQGWKDSANGNNGQTAKVKTLEDHDKKYHPHGYKEGDRCQFREAMGQKDKSDKLDGNNSANSGVDKSGKSAAANYLKLTKAPGRDRDEILEDIARKYGPSSRAVLVDPKSQLKNEEERMSKIRESLSFHGIDESSLNESERHDLGLRKPFVLKS